jgi:hypothetical protein
VELAATLHGDHRVRLTMAAALCVVPDTIAAFLDLIRFFT